MNGHRNGPRDDEEEKALQEAWGRALGGSSLSVLENGTRNIGNGVVVWDVCYDGDFTGEIAVYPEWVNSSASYSGHLFAESGTFIALPIAPMRKWLADNQFNRVFAREFGRTMDGHVIMPYRVAAEIALGQLTVGADEDGRMFKSGLEIIGRRL